MPIGLVGYIAIFTYDHARTWTNLREGAINGLIHAVLYSVGYFIFFVPLIALLIYSFRNRFQSFWLRSIVGLLPIIVLFIYSASNWLANPATDRNCFEKTMGFKMPTTAKNVLAQRFGGGLTDVSDVYYFDADQMDIQTMLRKKPFQPINGEPLRLPNHWPDPKNWPSLKTYRYNDGTWYYLIQTNGSFSKAIVSAWCI